MAAILFYDYVPDILEKRPPFREAHLGALQEYHTDGRVWLAGAFMEPTDGAAIVFSTVAEAESFVALDPYVANGLVMRWWVREWNVVVGERA